MNMRTLILRPAVALFLLLTLLTGPLYTLLVTGLAQALFPWRANGSLLKSNDRIVGSELIGQEFVSPRYFWSRPSSTARMPYDAGLSSGSNLGPLNPALATRVRQRAGLLRSFGDSTGPLPTDIVTSSGSGLDPHISVEAAEFQTPRVARFRHMSVAEVRSLVARYTSARTFGVLGEPRVNVLLLNLALDAKQSNSGER